jgi:hypothetical protein
VGATGFEGGDQIAPSAAENKADRASETGGIPTDSRRVADRPGHVATSPGSEPPELTVVELEFAIDRITRAMLTAPDDAIAELVAERRAMRTQLEALRLPANVTSLDGARGRRKG